jgi:hypothetical protein
MIDCYIEFILKICRRYYLFVGCSAECDLAKSH